ncbi:hypothetical protein L7F22_031822 [Adiantum nelumboides]|nr:hypothetical protein [Adiantum nelumboides]
MGRSGSDHDLSVKEMRNDKEVVSHSGTLSVQRMGDSDCAYHVVQCNLAGTSSSFQQKFTSNGPKDPEGQAAAYCFALSTGCLPAFREFLFKHPEIVNYGSTCTTDESHFTVFINLRKNAVLGLCFSAAVCRLQDGSLRSVSFRSVSEQLGFEQATAFFLSSKLRSWVLKAFKRGTLIANELENCRGDCVLMDKCKCCGESQRSDYSNQKSQQVSEEYRCSACLMMERKVIFAIRLEAQGEVAKSWETFCSETVSFNVHDNYEVCCVCGCEDNEDLDDLVPCICHSSEAVVHTSCSAACKPFTFVGDSRFNSTPWCLICGRGGVVSPHGDLANDGIAARGLKRSRTFSHVAGNDVKKPRRSSSDAVQQSEHMPNSEGSSPNHVEINSAVQKEAKEPDCTEIGSVRHLWRSADIPALVPFKKRRIQLSDVQRSPSPPLKPLSSAPHSPVSLLESSSKPIFMVPKSCSPKSDNSHSKIAASLFSSSPLTSPKSSSIVQCIPDTTQTVSKLPSTEAASPFPRSCSQETVASKSRSLSPSRLCSSLKSLSPKHAALPRSLSTVNSISVQLPMLPSLRMLEEAAIPLKSPNQESSQICTPLCDRDAPKVVQESDNVRMHSSLLSANQNQPSSSQEVEDGEFVISTEKNSIDCDIPDESPEVSSQIGWGQDSQGSRSSAPKTQNDRSGWDLNTNMEAWDPLSDKVVLARLKMGKGSRRMGKVIGQKFKSYDVIANEPLKLSKNELAKGIVGIDPDQISPCKEANAGSVAPVGEKMTAVCEGDGFEKLEADILGPRNSESKAGNGNGERQGLFRYSAAEKAERYAKKEDGMKRAEELEGEEQIDFGVLYSGDGYYEGWDFDDRSPILEDEAYWKGEDASDNPLVWEGNARLDGGEGESKGMHLNCSTSGRVKFSGWDQLPEGFESAEEALKAAQEVIARRRRSCISFGGRRLASLSSHRGNSVFYDIKKSSKCFGNRYLSDSSHSRDIINHTRGLDDSGDDCYPLRGRLRGQRAAAGPHGRGCHKGWAEKGKDDFNDEWGHRRHHSVSGFSSQGPTNAAKFAAARAPRRGFVVDHEGTLSRGRMTSEGMRSTFVNSRGLHTAGQVISADLDGGSNYFRGVSPRVDRCTAKSSKFGFALGERGVQQGGGTRFAASMSNRHPLPGRGFGDRHERSCYTSRNLEPRRSESPCGMHLPDHPFVNNCHSPSSRLEPRLKRSRFSPPSPEPFSRSKFYPPSARNQRSPPPSHKWSHDRREGENYRDFRKFVPRYKASGRTSPHVVHGSSLMDDRDLQVLAGTRSSSGVRGSLCSFRVESPVSRASRRAEEGGCTGSFFNGGDNGDVKGKVYKRERCRDDDEKREPWRSLSGPSGGHRRS